MSKAHLDRGPDVDLQKRFSALLEKTSVTEADIQKFMEIHSELIPTPFMLGHDLHFNSIISKFRLNACRIPDFAYLTKNSAYWRLVLIEIEHPRKQLFTKAARAQFHGDTRFAIDQIEDWKTRVATHLHEIREALRPIVHPEWFRDHPFEVKYALLIGRRHTGRWTSEQIGRIHTLEKENHIALMTYDSLLRMMHSHSLNVGRPKDILSHRRDRYLLKRRNGLDTSMFASLTPDEIQISPKQLAFYKARGYDMDAWLRYERLTVNDMVPRSRASEPMDEMFDQLAKARPVLATMPLARRAKPVSSS